MAGVRTRGLPMSHNSDRHKIQKRERTHMLNAKYGRHGNGGHGRRGHRTHANRRFPAQRGIDDTTRLADATIHYGSDAFYVSHDVLGDALSGKAPHDRIECVGSTVWRTSPDGKLVKVVVVNVKRAQEYNDRRKLRDMLNEMDKNEGLPSESRMDILRRRTAQRTSMSFLSPHKRSLASKSFTRNRQTPRWTTCGDE